MIKFEKYSIFRMSVLPKVSKVSPPVLSVQIFLYSIDEFRIDFISPDDFEIIVGESPFDDKEFDELRSLVKDFMKFVRLPNSPQVLIRKEKNNKLFLSRVSIEVVDIRLLTEIRDILKPYFVIEDFY